MPHQSDRRFLVLHALRLRGVAAAPDVAERSGVPLSRATALLADAAASGWAEHRASGALPGWSLTPIGRAEHARLAHHELVVSQARSTVQSAYERFRGENPTVLAACSCWQVRETGGRLVRNDHTDPRYDAAVLDDLAAVHGRARPLCDELTSVLARYERYGPELDHALSRALAGDGDHVASPRLRSYHSVWFELHEDLLSTLGLDRSAEAAS